MCQFRRRSDELSGFLDLGKPDQHFLRNGYHIQGRQQARKLPTPGSGEVVTKDNDAGLFWGLNQKYFAWFLQMKDFKKWLKIIKLKKYEIQKKIDFFLL